MATPSAPGAPIRLTTWSHRTVTVAAWCLLLGSLAVRTAVVSAGFFYWDDYAFQGRAARLPLLSSDYLLAPHNGHLMPGGFGLVAVAERLAPLNYWVPLLMILGLSLAAGWLTWRLLAAVFGARPLVLVPLAVVVLAPLTLLPTAWWAVAINLLPLQIAAALVGLATVAHHRSPGQVTGLGVVAAFLVGLLFIEKALLLPAVAVMVSLLLDDAPPGPRRVAASLRRAWGLWIALAAVAAGYLVTYLHLVDERPHGIPDPTVALQVPLRAMAAGVLPALVGGPLAWAPVTGGSAYSDPPGWVMLVAFYLCLAAVVAAVVLVPRSRWPWALVAGWLVADLVALVLGRGGPDTPLVIGQTMRYTADAAVPIALAIGASLMPAAGGATGARELRARRVCSQRPRATRVVVATAAVALVTASLVSAAGLVEPLNQNDSRRWLANVERSLATDAGRVRMLEAPVPDTVYNPAAYPQNQLSWVLAPLPDGPLISTQVADLKVFDVSGTLVDGAVTGVQSTPAPDGPCGWSVNDGSVRLASAVLPWTYTVRLGYLAAQDTTAVMTLGSGPPTEVTFQRGLHQVYVRTTGDGDAIRFGPTTRGTGICVSDATVGTVAPSAR